MMQFKLLPTDNLSMAHDQLKAILALPAQAIVTIPSVLVLITKDLHPFWTLQILFSIIASISGIASMTAGLSLLATTIRLFSRRGKGTLAPWQPPSQFVVEGIYRHVRNPMITGVILILLGESIMLISSTVFYWFCTFVVLNCIYIPLKEEPALRKRFGKPYEEYTKHVRRWIPRLKPWIPDVDKVSSIG
jgi:protein-S-isoprenylcysteine O-methyltransferase Ste14